MLSKVRRPDEGRLVLLVSAFLCITVVTKRAGATLVTADGTTIFGDDYEGAARLGLLTGGSGNFVTGENRPAVVGNWSSKSNFADQIEITTGGGGGGLGAAEFPGLPTQGDQLLAFARLDGGVRLVGLFDGVQDANDLDPSRVPAAGTQLHLETMLYVRDNVDGVGLGFATVHGDPGGLPGDGFVLRVNFLGNGAVTNPGAGGSPVQIEGGGGNLTYTRDAWHKWEIDWTVGDANFTVCVDDVCSEDQAALRPNDLTNGITIPNHGPDNPRGQVAFGLDADGGAGPPDPNKTWRHDTSGDWNVSVNWIGGIPDNILFSGPERTEEVAIFGDAIQSRHTVFTDLDVSVQAIQFINSNTYAIAGTGSVTLEIGTQSTESAIAVLAGSHEFQAAVNLNNETDVTVAGGSILTFFNVLNLQGNTLNKLGPGDIAIRSDLVTSGGTINILDGTIMGNGTVGGTVNNEAGTVSPGNSSSVGGQVPEPSAITLLVLGGLLVCWFCAASQRKTS